MTLVFLALSVFGLIFVAGRESMELFFLRHGPAEPKADWSGDDIERPLSAAGRMVVTELAAALAGQKLQPDRVLTSPYDRARETAQIVAARLGIPDRVIADRRLIPGFGLRQLSKILQDYTDANSLMLVGHGPDLTEVVRALTGGRLTIRKAGMAQVELANFPTLKGKLLSLIVPAPLDLAAGAVGEADADG